jgi:hypothetical protein
MNADGDARPLTQNDATALGANEIERLVRFFRILDDWDRNGIARDVSRVNQPAIACTESAMNIHPKPVPPFEE